MYCPYCGGKLKEAEVELPDVSSVDWDDQKKVDEYMALEDKKHGAIDMFCTGEKCCFKDCPLTFHHPIHGIKHKPGDSWSLSWIE